MLRILQGEGRSRHLHSVIQCDFDRDEIENAIRIAEAKLPHVAVRAPGGAIRGSDVQRRRLIAGKLADHAVLAYLRDRAEAAHAQVTVEEYDDIRGDDFKLPDECDIRVTNRAGLSRTVEVRSSFVLFLSSISSLLSHSRQSLIGWYTTGAKAAEERKDFYFQVAFFARPADEHPEAARRGIAVFHGDGREDRISAYIVAGATRSLIERDGESRFDMAERAQYRVLRPMTRAMSPGSTATLLLGLPREGAVAPQ